MVVECTKLQQELRLRKGMFNGLIAIGTGDE